MSAQRYNVSFEPELVARIDAVAGSRGRSAFLARAAEAMLSRDLAPGGRALPDPAENFERRYGASAHVHAAPEQLDAARGLPARRKERAAPSRRVTFDPSRFNQARTLR